MTLTPELPAMGGIIGVFVYIILPAAILYLVNSLFLTTAVPEGVPFVNEPLGKRSFSLKTRWIYLTNCESLFREAYTKYLKHGKPVMLPPD